MNIKEMQDEYDKGIKEVKAKLESLNNLRDSIIKEQAMLAGNEYASAKECAGYRSRQSHPKAFS